QEAINKWIQRRKYAKFLELWVKGLNIDWNKLYGDPKPRRISLPTYPFAKERYWVPEINIKSVEGITRGPAVAASIHPLLHQNTSTLSEQRFSSTFTGQESFLTDYVVKGQRILPGVAFLEMARAAVEQATENLKEGKNGIQLTNVVWAQPVMVGDQPVEIHIGLIPAENGEITFEIYSDSKEGDTEPIVYSKGNAILGSIVEVPNIDIAALKAQCCQGNIDHQGIEEVYTGLGQVLAKISLSSIDCNLSDQLILNPKLLDFILQELIELKANTIDLQSSNSTTLYKPILPFTLQELKIFRKITSEMWVVIRYNTGSKAGNKVQIIDIDVCDRDGIVCIQIKGLEIHSIEWVAEHEDHPIQRSKGFIQKQWELCSAIPTRSLHRTVAILTTQETRDLAAKLAQQFMKCEILDIYDLARQSQQAEQEWKNYDGCIDLTGCGTENHTSINWIAWLQNLIEEGHKEGLILLAVTKGLESYQNIDINLSGASRAGLYRMLQSEYSHLRSRHMDAERYTDDDTLVGQIVSEFFLESEDAEICYRNGKRYRAIFEEVKDSGESQGNVKFPEDHVLWITGGTRGLGYLCAEHFVRKYGVKRLVLSGRELMPKREQWDFYKDNDSIKHKIRAIQALEEKGVQVQVLSVALTDKDAVQKSLQEIKISMGPIGGIIHCAGIADVENPAFIRKSIEGVQQVLDPKIVGLDIMYQSFRAEPLQFFALFSSVSAVIPTLASGQSDYAMANAYMDYFAEAYRGSCPIVSIQWPSWKETGLGEIKSRAYMQTGLLSHTNDEGLQLLDQILSRKMGPVILPAIVNLDLWNAAELMKRTIQKNSLIANRQPYHPVMTKPLTASSDLVNATQAWLISLISNELKIDPARIEADTTFQDYGMDSILLAQVITKMERELKGISIDPSVILEYPTLNTLAVYLMQIYPEALASLFSIKSANTKSTVNQPTCNQPTTFPVLQRERRRGRQENNVNSQKDKVAIVGMACHFPDAMNTKEYWENLKLGKDSIREVSKSRWDWEKYYNAHEYKEGKSISKWGAFLDSIEEFDPGYFNIPRSLAPQIDPLQRQWLEVSAEALADAGYDKKDLWGKRVGVYAGARMGNFANKLKGAKKDRIVGTGPNFITVHLAHIYNFKGPNMVVDAACASSLAAIHLAVKSIQNGEAEIALAGGVEILLDESPFITLSAEKVLSPDGRCKTFDAEANGIGLGEGCGVLILKPLQKAIQDNNKIYGVIDGSAVNCDGNTMGITTPNPDAQRELIKTAISDANINPETISYMETHGTGTLIGDPIELKALTQIFTEHTTKKQFCGVGSIKSNIGHLLSAASVAGIIKVLLAITHQELPPTLHCKNPNPRFNFQDSPFYPVQGLKNWTSDNNILRAGVSAFGLGGNNAHIIVSNEGIPNTHKASLEPKGKRVIFNRKHYWPEEIKNYNEKNDLVQERFNYSNDDEVDEFIELFKIEEA
ncbi:beta-ketoacyl synthase N-terminal-like domain-containing protein, partial [Pelosinus baikalensis]